MLDYFFFIFCFLSINKAKIKGIDNYFSNYMKLENTNPLKGIFVWLIIFCHKSGYGVKKNYIYKKITRNLGQNVVSLFLFYSGFGIYENIKIKGFDYAKSLYYKAIVLFLKFQIILLIFLVTNLFILKNKITLKRYILSFIFKSSLGNSNWFAFSIISFYFYSCLAFSIVKNKKFIGIIVVNSICYLHIYLVYFYYYPKALYAVDTVLCFVAGLYFSCFRLNIDKIIMKNDVNYFCFISFIIYFYCKSSVFTNFIFKSINNVLFAIAVIFISMKISFKNATLIFISLVLCT